LLWNSLPTLSPLFYLHGKKRRGQPVQINP